VPSGPIDGLGDRAFFRVNLRLEPEQLEAGVVASSLNGRMDRGSWQPRKAIRNLSGALEVDGDPLFLPFWLVDTSGGLTISAAERVDELVTLTVTHGFEVDTDPAWLGVESLTGAVDPNGVHLVTRVDATTLTFEIAGATGSETYGGTGKIRSVIDDAEAAEIYGSCLFSDPSSDSEESIVIAATGKAILVSVADGTTTDIDYPTGLTLSAEADLLQAFDKVLLFRDGLQAWEWYPNGRAVTAGARASNVVTLTLANHGLTVGDTVDVSGITGFGADDPNGTVVVTGIPTADTFTYADTGGDDSFDDNTGTVSAGLTKVRAGTYTQPQVFEETGTDVVVSSGLCTISGLTNTTVATGDTVIIYGTDNTSFLPYIGRSFVVTAATSSAFSFYIPIEDLATISTDTLTIGKQVSVGAGFQHMPAPPWGIYHQRRLIVPYRYSQTGTTASPTFTDREVRDELMISDILDSDTYDAIENQFRITAGTANFLVGCYPFADDQLVVFMRNSVHLISGLSGALSDCTTALLTEEIGCIARKSVAVHGNRILFLSDNGVFALEYLDSLNLRGVDLPLSDAIQPIIDRINADLAGDSVGVYFGNRYYLAVPLDSAAGVGDATGNNAILVFNFLNSGWESVDSVDDGRWDVLNFHIARAGERNDLYAVNSNGGVHKLDAVDSDTDELALSPGADIELLPVVSSLQTRAYDAGMPDRKRWTRITLQTEAASQACDYEIEFATDNPDSAQMLGAFSTLEGAALDAGETYSQRVRVGGYRGHSASVTIIPTQGRPKVKNIHVEASETNKSTVSQS
jgi:hypothetical protein